MGVSGTDVAREAADTVLADDNFVSMYAAVQEGRITFDNLQKATFYLLSAGMAAILALLTSLALCWPPIFLPAQILWLNMVVDGFQDVAMAFEPGEEDVLKRPPRGREESIIPHAVGAHAAGGAGDGSRHSVHVPLGDGRVRLAGAGPHRCPHHPRYLLQLSRGQRSLGEALCIPPQSSFQPLPVPSRWPWPWPCMWEPCISHRPSSCCGWSPWAWRAGEGWPWWPPASCWPWKRTSSCVPFPPWPAGPDEADPGQRSAAWRWRRAAADWTGATAGRAARGSGLP